MTDEKNIYCPAACSYLYYNICKPLCGNTYYKIKKRDRTLVNIDGRPVKYELCRKLHEVKK